MTDTLALSVACAPWGQELFLWLVHSCEPMVNEWVNFGFSDFFFNVTFPSLGIVFSPFFFRSFSLLPQHKAQVEVNLLSILFFPPLKLIFKNFKLHLFSVFLGAQEPWHVCGGQRKTCISQFSPSMSIVETEFRSSGLVAGTFPCCSNLLAPEVSVLVCCL